MNISCIQKPKSGCIITITADNGQMIDSFDAPTSDAVLYCMQHFMSKYTRRLRAAAAIAARLDRAYTGVVGSTTEAAANDESMDKMRHAMFDHKPSSKKSKRGHAA